MDGCRGLISTAGELRVRGRHGWNMTALLPELEELPAGLVLDGELFAFFDEGGAASAPAVLSRIRIVMGGRFGKT